MDDLAYQDGAFVPLDAMSVGIRTHALQYGTGVFEGIRAYWNAEQEKMLVFRQAEHYRRLVASARMLRMSVAEPVERLCAITAQLLAHNDLREDAYIRPMVFKSSEALGLWHQGMPESLAIFSVPFGRYMHGDGVRCCVSSWRRPDANALPSRAKLSGSYVHSAVARAEALDNGFDEAIMLSSRGYVAEGTGENIFLAVDGTLVTPCAGEDLLAGITRDTILTLAARELAISPVERSVNRGELYVADEIFLCGTAAEITPVLEVDGHSVGSGQPGPLTRRLQALYSEVVHGERDDYRSWCWEVDAGAAPVPQAIGMESSS